jgi:geranylgeranyl pyrophosphate synthase
MLGNSNLTPAEFERCKDIFTESGSLKYAQNRAEQYVEQALSALQKQTGHWEDDGLKFLRGLAQYLLTRTA